jgi:hypothetical protein
MTDAVVLRRGSIDGYSLRSFVRASSAVKRHSTPAFDRLRASHQAPTSRPGVSMSGIRRLKHCLTKTESSTSTMFSHDPCTGVWTNWTLRARRRATSGAKAP